MTFKRINHVWYHKPCFQPINSSQEQVQVAAHASLYAGHVFGLMSCYIWLRLHIQLTDRPQLHINSSVSSWLYTVKLKLNSELDFGCTCQGLVNTRTQSTDNTLRHWWSLKVFHCKSCSWFYWPGRQRCWAGGGAQRWGFSWMWQVIGKWVMNLKHRQTDKQENDRVMFACDVRTTQATEQSETGGKIRGWISAADELVERWVSDESVGAGVSRPHPAEQTHRQGWPRWRGLILTVDLRMFWFVFSSASQLDFTSQLFSFSTFVFTKYFGNSNHTDSRLKAGNHCLMSWKGKEKSFTLLWEMSAQYANPQIKRFC